MASSDQSSRIMDSNNSETKLVPATLDLAERARLAINAMTEATDPQADYRVYWKATFRSTPPIMYHDFSDTGIAGKFMECLPRMRIMSGSNQGAHVEERWRELLPTQIGDDGLVYTNLDDRFSSSRTASSMSLKNGDPIVDMQVNGIMLGVMSTYIAMEGKEYWEPLGREITDGLSGLAVRDGTKAFFQKWVYLPGESIDSKGPRPLGTEAAHGIWPARRLIHFYNVTGYEPALSLAKGLCKYVHDDAKYFGPGYTFLSDDPDPKGTRHHVNHFHHHSMSILSWLEYSQASGDESMLNAAISGFDKAKTYGEELTGFFPESIGDDVPHTSEICEVGDMVSIAVGLAAAGAGDHYWDDADRWVRNQLSEGQLLRHDWIYRINLATPPTSLNPNMTIDRVGERNIGGFSGWQSMNDWIEFQRAPDRGGVRDISPGQMLDESLEDYYSRISGPRNLGHVQGIMHCCTANGARGLYDAWRNIIHEENQQVKVNLLLNRVGKAVDVESHLPYTGQVDIRVRESCKLSVRIPLFVDLSKIRCQVNDSFITPVFNGRYAAVGSVKPGTLVTFIFPLDERTSRVTAKNQWYFLVRKGNDVVSIDPKGKLNPLYSREHYRDGVTLWKRSDRYRADISLDW